MLHDVSFSGLIDELEQATNLTTEEQSLLSPVSRTRADSDCRFQELINEAETQLIDHGLGAASPTLRTGDTSLSPAPTARRHSFDTTLTPAPTAPRPAIETSLSPAPP